MFLRPLCRPSYEEEKDNPGLRGLYFFCGDYFGSPSFTCFFPPCSISSSDDTHIILAYPHMCVDLSKKLFALSSWTLTTPLSDTFESSNIFQQNKYKSFNVVNNIKEVSSTKLQSNIKEIEKTRGA